MYLSVHSRLTQYSWTSPVFRVSPSILPSTWTQTMSSGIFTCILSCLPSGGWTNQSGTVAASSSVWIMVVELCFLRKAGILSALSTGRCYCCTVRWPGCQLWRIRDFSSNRAWFSPKSQLLRTFAWNFQYNSLSACLGQVCLWGCFLSDRFFSQIGSQSSLCSVGSEELDVMMEI